MAVRTEAKKAKPRSSRKGKKKGGFDFSKFDTGARIAYFMLFLLIVGSLIRAADFF